MDSDEIRKKFLEFFEKRGHKIIPSSSLIPDDPSVLLTTAGMQQFKPYFLGKADPIRDLGSHRAASIQKSFRTSDINEVGDASHLTFFEMLGHFSFGDYFKNETIEWTYQLLTEVFKIDKARISATVFAGDDKIPFDKESHDAWSKFLPQNKIRKGPRADNVWGPAGSEGPCGAANEVYVDDLEVATLVFMEYHCAKDGGLMPLPQKGVDVGWGLERLAMIVQGKKNIFDTDLFSFIMPKFPETLPIRTRRIIADHVRAVVFLISDDVRSSNKEAGYVLRRLLRRIIALAEMENVGRPPEESLKSAVEAYKTFPDYRNLDFSAVEKVYKEEYIKFLTAVARGRKEFEKEANAIKAKKTWVIPRAFAFNLYQSAGITIDVLEEFARKEAVEIDKKAFAEDIKRHQEISRAGIEKKFGGHGLILDTGEIKAANEEELKKVTRLHTATHLLNSALRSVLGTDTQQQGSDITADRTRFDFTFPRKLTGDEIQKIEELVNHAIKKDFPVTVAEMDAEKAKKSGALFFFKGKYPARVRVYTIGDEKETFSKELCGGPHVTHTGEVGKFKIIKEEAPSSGIRRIRATVDPVSLTELTGGG